MKSADIINPGTDLRSQFSNVWKLGVPAVLTQITTILMQYIDSAMVGSLGANASASIGLVTPSTWMVAGLGYAVAIGFSVQLAQYIGAGEVHNARRVLKHGFSTSIIISLITMLFCLLISSHLPAWLGGDEVLRKDASAYFLVFALTIPFMELNRTASSFLQSAGNMLIPSILNAAMCLLDVVLNAIFIPKYGVLGAAVGTGLSVVFVSFAELWFCLIRFEPLRINRREKFKPDISILKRAFRIASPVAIESIAMPGASVVATTIIAPLGPVVLAAHSFAITAEAICYMPGFGISGAASTLVGQSIGFGDYKLAVRYGYLTVLFGCATMTTAGIIMFIACPALFRLLTPVAEVQTLAAEILRIQLLAEPAYGIAMVASGVLRGAEDTLIPSILNLFSIWVVRISLALILVPIYGIHGMWAAMGIELCFRGALMLTRQIRSKYLHPEKSTFPRLHKSRAKG